jgi:acyl-CoA thioester hydrolase
MTNLYSRVFNVRYAECDIYEHVNNAVYLHYLQEALIEAETKAGYPPQRFREQGYEWWLGRTEIEYLIPLVYGGRVELTLQTHQYSKEAAYRSIEFRKKASGELAARASVVSVLRKYDTQQPVPM